MRRHAFAAALRLVAISTVFVAAVALCSIATASTTLTLTKDFINEVRDRATITVGFVVDKVHDHPKPPSQDGDIHIAGWSDEIGLTTVAEVMNSKHEDEAVDRANAVEDRSEPVQIVGVWRIWPEHGGEHHFVQGEEPPHATDTNPDHIF